MLLQKPWSERKKAVLVIHLNPRYPGNLTYEHGTIDEGVNAVREVLATAYDRNYPIILDCSNRELVLPGRDDNRRVISVDNTLFYAAAHGIERFILIGFNRVECVKTHAQTILQKRKSFATTDYLLFGNCDFDTEKEMAETLEYFRNNGTLYDEHRRLIEGELSL